MDTRVGRSLSGAHSESVETAGPGWLPPVSEVARALPERVARTMGALLQPGSTLLGRVGVSPMSYEWLRECAVDCAKRGDVF